MSSVRILLGLLLSCLLAACADREPLPPREPFEAPPRPPVTAETALEPVIFVPPPDGRTKAPPPLDQLLAKLPPLYDDAAAGDGDGADRWESLRTALERNRGWLRSRPAGTVYRYGPREVDASLVLAGVEELLGWLESDPTPEDFGARIPRAFELYESVGDGSEDVPAPVGKPAVEPMLVTGYYLPEIEGSLERRPGYVPILRPPPGVVRVDLGAFDPQLAGRRISGFVRGRRLVPLPHRRDLRESGGAGQRILAWAKDRVDLFFLEIQGSGVLRLPDGSTRRIGYAGANGRPYRSIGQLLIAEGEIPREEMSMQALRAWLAAHPEEVDRVLDHNEAVVFFRWLDGPAVGNLGVPVTAGRSIAVDQSLLPPGGVAFLSTTVPREAGDAEPLDRFVVAQDTGGAIRGAHRVDFYWGPGEEAAANAGRMKQPGRLIYLVPKPRLGRSGADP